MVDLSSTDKIVYGLLITLGSKSDYIYAKNDFMAETLGISLYQLKKSLNTLKTKKLIRIANPNRYREIEILPIQTVKPVKDREINSETEELLNRIYDKM